MPDFRPPLYIIDTELGKRVHGHGRQAYINEVLALGFEVCQCEIVRSRLPAHYVRPHSGPVGIEVCRECGCIQHTLQYIYLCDECCEPMLTSTYPPQQCKPLICRECHV